MTIFEEYLDHPDPEVRRRAIDWRCSIGLQDVDDLRVSDFLIEQARRNIEGEITVDEVQQLIDEYYRKKNRQNYSRSKYMTNRVFLTGGAHGIGKSIVEAFANRGDKVGFCDTDEARGEAVAAQTGAAFYKVDVTDAAQLEAAIQQVFDAWGDIDVLVNNVGIGMFKPLTAVSVEEFDRVISTNLRSAFITARMLARHRNTNGNTAYGRIINLCSTRYLQSEAGTRHRRAESTR